MQKNRVVKIQSKPITKEAIQWTGDNEPFIRQFVADNSLLRFPDGKLEVWNSEEMSWSNVPHLHWVIKGLKGEFYPCSAEVLNRSYNVIVEADPIVEKPVK